MGIYRYGVLTKQCFGYLAKTIRIIDIYIIYIIGLVAYYAHTRVTFIHTISNFMNMHVFRMMHILNITNCSRVPKRKPTIKIQCKMVKNVVTLVSSYI